MKKGKRSRPSHSISSSTGVSNTRLGLWLFFAFLFLCVLGLIISIVAYPWPHSHYYRDSKLVYGEKRGRTNCTIGERYDSDLDICAPISYLPTPISLELMDKSRRPCDGFFEYMGGQWIKDHENENRAFTYAHRKNQKRIHDIIQDPKSGPIYNFYRSCLDTLVHQQHIFLDASQVKHVREHIMGAFQSHGDLPVVFARLLSYGFTSPFMVSIEPHPTEYRMVPLIKRDIFSTEPGIPSLEGFPVTMVYDFEQVMKKLNQWHDNTEFEGTYLEYVQSEYFKQDMTTMRTLIDASPSGFWELYLRELNGYSMEEDIVQKDQPVWLLDRTYMQNLLHGLHEISLREWRAYFEFTLAYHTKKYIPQLPSDSYFRLHNPIKQHARFRHRMFRHDNRPSEHVCMEITHKLLPGTIGNVFIDRYMKHDETKRQVTEIVENVRDAFIEMIKESKWLSRETQDMIVDKLRAMIIRVIHPNFYEEEPYAARLTMDSYLRNLNIIRRYIATRNFELWTKGKPNRDLIQRFGSPVTTVNAFYSPVTNTISIFGGILTEPFYNETFSDIALYAGIGMIASHEIGHGLDNRGRWYDKEGSICLTDPWKQNETNDFNRRMHCLIKEYEAPFGCINAGYGEQTIGEDLSDLNGVRAALKALKKHRGGKLTRVEQRQFFQVFAQLWMENYSQDIYCERVQNDEHAIAMFRVDKTLRQMKEFWEAFNCQKGDRMHNNKPCEMFG